MSYTYITREDQLKDVLDFFNPSNFKDRQGREVQVEIALDTETTGLSALKEKVLLIQLGNEKEQFVIDVAKTGEKAIPRVLDTLNANGSLFVAHNAEFDLAMLRTNFGFDPDNVACTMIGAVLLSKGNLTIKNSLEACLDKYLGYKADKGEQTSFVGMKFGDTFTDSQIKYAAKDVELLLPLHKKILEALQRRDMVDLLYSIENETIKSMVDLHVNGIYIDKEQWLGVEAKAKQRLLAAKEKLDAHFTAKKGKEDIVIPDLFGSPRINYASPDQLKVALEKLLEKSIVSTNEKDLKKLKDTTGVIEDLLSFREAQKKVSTYGRKFLEKYVNLKTGRIHSSFKQLGADSGRMASRDPNLQNIPAGKDYREPFKVQDRENYRMISADFSGQELRLLAYISEEEKFITALKENKDLHSYSASLIFGIDYNDFFVLDDSGQIMNDKSGDPIIKPEMKKKYRNPAKSITFG